MNALKVALLKVLWLILGRRNLVRLSRFLANESRLDSSNDMESNGEQIVQAICLQNAVGRTAIFFDVGANVGIWTKSALEQGAGKGALRVHSFEPWDETFKTLKANLEAWELIASVVPNALAVSSQTGSVEFFSSGPNMGINGLYGDTHGAAKISKLIPSTSLDDYCADHGVERIDLLKIDAEGHDMEVILGATKLVQAGRINVAQFEYNHRWISARHYLKDAFQFFQPCGYAIGKVTPTGIEFYKAWDPELETFREGNYVAVLNSLAPHFPQIEWWNCQATARTRS
jgi:FkbM family methyltransferase